jgi:hypothetical protein
MKATLRLTTQSSIWSIDEDSHIFQRVPRTEDPSHPRTSYDLVGRPETYNGEIEFVSDGPDAGGKDREFALIYLGEVRYGKNRVKTGYIEKKEVLR